MLRAKVQTTFPARPSRPASILWEGVLVFEDPDHPDTNGRPNFIMKVQCGLRDWDTGPFLTMPTRQEAYVDDDGKPRMRAAKWIDREGKTNYTNLVQLGRALSDMGAKAVMEHLEAEKASPSADLRSEAAGLFEDLKF